jgi:hypothetical protein
MVEIWSWIIGYAILFAVVQLAIYAYYVRRGEASPRANAIGDPDEYSRVGEPVQRDHVTDDDIDDTDSTLRTSDDDTMQRCPHCGTPNETVSTVRYCRHCTRSLG